MDPNCFNLKRNYYIISTLNIIFKLIWWVCKTLGIVSEKAGEKSRVVMIGKTHIGDILMATPAIRYAKDNRSYLKIICIVSTTSQAILIRNQNVEKSEVINLPWLGEKGKGVFHDIKSFFGYVKKLKALNAETVINFNSTGYHIDHLAMWLAGIPNRIGYAHKGLNYLLTFQVPFIPNELIAQQKLKMVGCWLNKKTARSSLRPDYFVSPKATARARDLLFSLNLNGDKPVIGVNVGANHNFLWPESYFIELCNLLLDKWPLNIIFIGTVNDIPVTDRIMARIKYKTFSLVGRTTLEEVAEIIKNFDLLITVDTGVRHIANAVGTYVTVLRNGANSIYEFGKYVTSEEIIINKVSCSPCGRTVCPNGNLECMNGIRPDKVVSVVEKRIEDIIRNKINSYSAVDKH